MPILPAATVACGFILTAAWVAFLGFELFRAVNFIFLGREPIHCANDCLAINQA
jgi:hypothetical protein